MKQSKTSFAQIVIARYAAVTFLTYKRFVAFIAQSHLVVLGVSENEGVTLRTIFPMLGWSI